MKEKLLEKINIMTTLSLNALMDPISKPFLKWAGSKTKLVNALRPLLPVGDYRFFEPFLGSGAVFLNTDYPVSFLSDSNKDIINLYLLLKEKGKKFIQQCKNLFIPENNFADRFYELRDEFNRTADVERRAAIFVYLNRHCFNGLCRYNREGEFNTPFGKYDQVPFPAAQMEFFAQKLKSAVLQTQDFRISLSEATSGDIVYCDPPYVPISDTAKFTNYAAGGFNERDQRELSDACIEAAQRGAVVLISNHDTPCTRHLYAKASQVIPVLVSRTISCDGQNRNKAKELIAVFRKDL